MEPCRTQRRVNPLHQLAPSQGMPLHHSGVLKNGPSPAVGVSPIAIRYIKTGAHRRLDVKRELNVAYS